MKKIHIKKLKRIVLCICLISFAGVTFAKDSEAKKTTGKQVFEKYCWGCHHQKSTAFGPSFYQIANTRSQSQASLHIANPALSYKQLGYRRTAMPAFATVIKAEELNLILDYIFSFKEEKNNQTKEVK